MPNIQINIKNKVARADRAIIVCDNSDYTAVFDFDAEWDEYTTKTARFVYGGTYTDVVFTGNSCPIPKMQDARSLYVGVYAGDLHTTTPAYISCVPSILCGDGIPADPTPDVYAQIMELLNKESGVWYPAVDDAGNMSWTRSISETDPQPVNIKGPKGDAGADGADGKSAYELAQDNGFQGTMQEWLASLVGADGANGADGNDGISPTVSVAAITGGNRVTITDAEGAKTFDVMDGAQGASGADGKDYVLTDTDKQEIAKTAAGLVDVPSVQPDWNQNDSTQPDYIKNRPFYTGDPVETVLVEESTVSFAEDRGLYVAQLPSTFAATVGETYKVYWDGAAYECTCVNFNDATIIGNLSITGEGSDTGEPFVMGIANGERIQIVTADTSASHTFSISRFAQEVVKIDKKYLVQPDWNQNDSTQPDYIKNRPFYTGNPVVVEESTVSFAEDRGLYRARILSTFAPTVGETYKVYWDGAAYECTCVDFRNTPVIGNLAIIGEGSDTGEPFVMDIANGRGIEIYTADTSASHTFSISSLVLEVVKIDEKYLPKASENSYGIIKTSDVVSAYNFPVLAQHDQMVDAIAAFKTGNASIVWGGSNVIHAKYNSSSDTISVVFAKEPMRLFTYSNDSGFYNRTLGSSTYGELQGNQVRIVNNNNVAAVLTVEGESSNATLTVGAERISIGGSYYGVSKTEMILQSSTAGSTKNFKITVDDSGTITATEVS